MNTQCKIQVDKKNNELLRLRLRNCWGDNAGSGECSHGSGLDLANWEACWRATLALAFQKLLAVRSECGYWHRYLPNICSMWISDSACTVSNGCHVASFTAHMLAIHIPTFWRFWRVCGANWHIPLGSLCFCSRSVASSAHRSCKITPLRESSHLSLNVRPVFTAGALDGRNGSLEFEGLEVYQGWKIIDYDKLRRYIRWKTKSLYAEPWGNIKIMNCKYLVWVHIVRTNQMIGNRVWKTTRPIR